MKRLVLAMALVMFSVPAWADFQAGVDAYKRVDYPAAFREFKPLAERGNAAAQSNLGSMYQNGQGVRRDYRQAVKWYRQRGGCQGPQARPKGALQET